MIEQKLDRIIELLEVIAADQVRSRTGRNQETEARRNITEHREQLRGKRLTFPEICEIIGIENTKQNQIIYGSALDKHGVKKVRTSNKRYYIFT